MYAKFRSTLTALFAACAMLAAGALIGEPVRPVRDRSATAPRLIEVSAESSAGAAKVRPRRRQVSRVQVTMPYFSFAKQLPAGSES